MWDYLVVNANYSGFKCIHSIGLFTLFFFGTSSNPVRKVLAKWIINVWNRLATCTAFVMIMPTIFKTIYNVCNYELLAKYTQLWNQWDALSICDIPRSKGLIENMISRYFAKQFSMILDRDDTELRKNNVIKVRRQFRALVHQTTQMGVGMNAPHMELYVKLSKYSLYVRNPFLSAYISQVIGHQHPLEYKHTFTYD